MEVMFNDGNVYGQSLKELGGARKGYWGPATASIDWCEENYVHTVYIAEFWNTLSNIFFVLLALHGMRRSIQEGLELRFQVSYVAIILVGVGSATFHGTLRYVEQQCDETPMVWGLLTWAYAIFSYDWENHRNLKILMPMCLAVYGLAFAIVHAYFRFTTFFQLHFMVLTLIMVKRLYHYYENVKNPAARHVAHMYIITGLTGVCAWMIDYHMCERVQQLPFNPQGHAWWHFFMALNSYYGPVFIQFVRAKQLHLDPTIDFRAFSLPTIVTNYRPNKSDL